MQLMREKSENMRLNAYKGKVKTVNDVKDYLWTHKNTLRREQIMRMAILIDRMSTNIESLEKQLELVDPVEVERKKQEKIQAEKDQEKQEIEKEIGVMLEKVIGEVNAIANIQEIYKYRI